MDYTTNYHLPQWVESDRIMMEDFNEAMAAIDGGIKAAQNTADGGTAAAEAAQNAANKAQETADKNCWFKLSELRFSTAGTHSIDLSGVDLSQYCKLVLECRYQSGYQTAVLYINNDRSGNYYGFNTDESNGGIILPGSGDKHGGGTVILYAGGNAIIARIESDTLNSFGGAARTECSGYNGCGWSGLSSLHFDSSSTGEHEYILFGVRK